VDVAIWLVQTDELCGDMETELDRPPFPHAGLLVRAELDRDSERPIGNLVAEVVVKGRLGNQPGVVLLVGEPREDGIGPQLRVSPGAKVHVPQSVSVVHVVCETL
jgi:hypothetical protein